MSFVKDDIVKVAKQLGFDLEEIDGKSYRDIHSEILKLKPELHTRKELTEFAHQLTDKLMSEYGFDAYRIYVSYPLIRTKGYCGFEEVHLYKQIHEAMGCSSKAFCKLHKINHFLDLAILEHEFKNIYENKYGFLSMFADDCQNLIMLMQMVHRHGFDPEYIEVIEVDIEDALVRAGDKFFHKQDLTNRDIITQLYKIVGERYGFDEYRFGLFQDYDGYGNVVFRL